MTEYQISMLYSFSRRLKSTSAGSIVKSEVPADIGRVVKQAQKGIE